MTTVERCCGDGSWAWMAVENWMALSGQLIKKPYSESCKNCEMSPEEWVIVALGDCRLL